MKSQTISKCRSFISSFFRYITQNFKLFEWNDIEKGVQIWHTPLIYLRLNSKSTFIFNKSCSNVISEGVFFYQKSKSRHYSVVFRTLKLYFSQKNRCPNLAHPPLTYLRLKSKAHFCPFFFNKSCSNVISEGVFFIINLNPLTVLSSLED